jgi:hypothetical protein
MNRFLFGSGNSPRGVLFGSRGAGISAVAVFAILLLATPVWAQRYRQIKPRLTEREERAMRGTVDRAIRSQTGFGADAAAVTDYFMKYYFPKMTQTDPDSLAELGDRREDLFARFIRAAKHEQSQTTLTDLSLTVATAISRGGYHPAVRYNAALILGNLDQKYAGGSRNDQTPPTPLPAATAGMLDLLEQEDFNGVKVHPSVRLGALVGLERHAQYGIASQHAQRVTKAALDIIAQENSSEEISQDVHHWMKCRAASVLVRQHREKPIAELQAALNTLMTSEELDLESRCFIAGLMERLDYSKAEGMEPAANAAALGSLSQDMLKVEAKLADEYQQEILGGGGGQVGLFGGRGGGGGGNDQPKYERRQLLSRLQSIYEGGNSLAEGAPDDAKSQVQGLLNAMKPARLAARDKDSTLLEIAEVVIQAAEDVDQVIKSWGQAAAPAPAAEPAAPEEPAEIDFS